MSNELQALSSILDPDQISFTDADRHERSVDWGTSEENGVPPDVVVWPESTADVAAVLSWANEERIPVTPYAAGTSLEGNAVPLEKGISLDMNRMDEIYEIRPDNLQVDVGPGIYGDEINEAVGKQGLILPSLPSSGKISTIGGMLANDASGMKTVKYGEVADWLLEVEAVLPTGKVITAGSKATKTSSGYNLLDLLVGSEGTLGVITRATLQLAGRPEQVWGGRATFSALGDAADAIFDTIRSGVDVAKIELIDSISAEMANASLDTGLSNSPMVFLEFHANHNIEAEVEFCRTIFEAHDVTEFAVAESGPEMTDLWEARRELADAVDPFDPDLSSLTPGDVTVPISEYPEMVRYVKELGEEYDFLIPCFGHAGDGNLHYFVMVDVEDQEMVAKGEQISKQIVEKAIKMNGTATGEHGVGIGKQDYLASEHGDAAVEAMRSIKKALDPNGILNPGKVLPEP
ncbi:FAD-binding oxidoreductase [Natrialba aegyptia]|uniref:D-lactate dehydrogenase (cytochrome) n=1 Tax=Natrialba aegyptia DSM 13077 TaxID=1227491 RepID=M0ARJ3_9EURY|nr:FAD-binding oxidoreductase [Natrialba aegyptia]ELZ01346.1 D-lactate dehydrogenase [Natrialba aegyptia DSM 13077]